MCEWLKFGDHTSQRCLVIYELLETERSYIGNLDQIYRLFYDPVRSARVLSRAQFNGIFLKWISILKISYAFFIALSSCLDDALHKSVDPCIGAVLLEQFRNFEVYRLYCSHQAPAAELLEQCLSTNDAFYNLVNSDSNISLPLSSFLMKPVQRITKYKLLVDRIVKNTPEDHPDYKDLSDAYVFIDDLIHSINTSTMVSAFDRNFAFSLNIGRFIITDRSSSADSVEPSSNRLLYYGSFMQYPSNKKCVVFLFTDALFLATPLFRTDNKRFGLPPADGKTQNFSFDLIGTPIPMHALNVQLGVPKSAAKRQRRRFRTTLNVDSSLKSTVELESGSCDPPSHVCLDQPIFSLYRNTVFVFALKAYTMDDRARWFRLLRNATQEYIRKKRMSSSPNMFLMEFLVVTVKQCRTTKQIPTNIRFNVKLFNPDDTTETKSLTLTTDQEEQSSLDMRFPLHNYRDCAIRLKVDICELQSESESQPIGHEEINLASPSNITPITVSITDPSSNTYELDLELKLA